MLAAVAGIVGCASSDRMFEVSPFSDEVPSPDRVNVWPLFYSDAGKSAVMWPLIDWDEEGFAVRPLVARDNDELDLLWPLAQVDLETGDFWALTAYHDHDDDLHGLFPLVGWGQLNYLGPVWWTCEQTEERAVDGYGLFPIVWRDVDADATVVFPLWWDFHDQFALAPFYWRDRFTDSQVFFPLWWDLRSPAGGSRSQTLFPLWHFAEHGDRRRLITPLGGRGWSSDGTTRFVNVLGPLYHHSETDEDSYTAVAWPLFIAERGKEWSRTALHPFWMHEQDARNEETSVLLGLGRHLASEDGDAWRAWPLLATTSAPSQESFIDLFTLYAHHEQRRADEMHLGTALLFQLNCWDLPDDEGGQSDESDDSSWEAHVAMLLSFGHDATPSAPTDRYDSVTAAQPDAHFTRDHAGFLFDWLLWEKTTQSGPDTLPATVARHARIPLLFEYESDPKVKQWDTLLWCLDSNEAEAESRFVAGWGLYRSVERADAVSRDIFPFMTYDRDDTTQQSSFSFLWRLWHYQRHGDKSGGHLLFIPWGEALDDASS